MTIGALCSRATEVGLPPPRQLWGARDIRIPPKRAEAAKRRSRPRNTRNTRTAAERPCEGQTGLRPCLCLSIFSDNPWGPCGPCAGASGLLIPAPLTRPAVCGSVVLRKVPRRRRSRENGMHGEDLGHGVAYPHGFVDGGPRVPRGQRGPGPGPQAPGPQTSPRHRPSRPPLTQFAAPAPILGPRLAPGFPPPRFNGKPDFTGVWNNETLTGINRAPTFGSRLVLTEAETRVIEGANDKLLARAYAPTAKGGPPSRTSRRGTPARAAARARPRSATTSGLDGARREGDAGQRPAAHLDPDHAGRPVSETQTSGDHRGTPTPRPGGRGRSRERRRATGVRRTTTPKPAGSPSDASSCGPSPPMFQGSTTTTTSSRWRPTTSPSSPR